MEKRLSQAVILAGGLGTRLRPLTDHLAKPMIEINGRPFAHYLVEMLRAQGFQEVVFLLGYRSETVSDYFGDGDRFGISIRYSVSPVEAETGTRLRGAMDLLDRQFLLMYCDNYWPLQMDRVWECWKKSGAEALLTVYSNDDGLTKSNLSVSANGLIEVYDKTRTAPGLQGVDIGFGIFSRKHVQSLPAGNVSFEREVYAGLVARGQLAAYVTRHRYYSIGSHSRLESTREYLKFKPVVFLDRDGVLNRKPAKGHYVTTPKEFVWLADSIPGVVRLSQAGYRVCIVTNQAGVARGMVDPNELQKIHEQLAMAVERSGGHIDAIYCCPHHWDERCQCRKPQPGMFFSAQRALQCDLTRSYFVGDQDDDRLAADRAGCRFKLKSEDSTLLEIAQEIIREDQS